MCGLVELTGDVRAEVQSTWLNYVSVGDADVAVAQVGRLGGDIIENPVDIPDAGRKAILRDPQGAVVAVWQPRTRIGAGRVNDVGCLCMNELTTPDVEGACFFYEGLFGWTIEVPPEGSDGPSMVFNGEHVNAAVFPAPEGVAAHWRPCFTVESTQDSVERVRHLGGQQLLEPLDIGHGTIAVVCDAQGAVFSIFAGETDP